jgi:hypothetical protein
MGGQTNPDDFCDHHKITLLLDIQHSDLHTAWSTTSGHRLSCCQIDYFMGNMTPPEAQLRGTVFPVAKLTILWEIWDGPIVFSRELFQWPWGTKQKCGKQPWSQDQIFFITWLVVVHYARQTWFNIYGSYGAFTLDVKSMSKMKI